MQFKKCENTHGGMSLLVKLQAYMTHKNIRRNVNSDLSIVTIFWSLVESSYFQERAQIKECAV